MVSCWSIRKRIRLKRMKAFLALVKEKVSDPSILSSSGGKCICLMRRKAYFAKLKERVPDSSTWLKRKKVYLAVVKDRIRPKHMKQQCK